MSKCQICGKWTELFFTRKERHYFTDLVCSDCADAVDLFFDLAKENNWHLHFK